MGNLVLDGELKFRYGLWGYFVEYLFQFLNLMLGEYINKIFLIQLIFALQVSTIWSIVINKIINKTNLLSLIIFFSPFILNYLTLCSRDSIALGLIFVVIYKGWSKFKLLISFLISIIIHKATIPLVITSTFIYKNEDKSKKFFLFLITLSILIAIVVQLLLRYSDIISFLPNSPYKEVLLYPRIGFQSQEDISDLVRRAYNFYGNFNLKILIFGLTGQFLCLFFKKNFPNNIFSLSFSTFFICAALSSIPNADRLTYHCILIASPFLLNFLINFMRDSFKKDNLFKNKNL
tara:strand:- start:240 stop:1112 length:873 start_codon:yes stop_codon:yes gene_type:complete